MSVRESLIADAARAAAVFPVGSKARSFLDRATPLIVGALLDIHRIAEATESKRHREPASDDATYEAKRQEDAEQMESEAAFWDKLASLAAAAIVGNKLLRGRLSADETDPFHGYVQSTVLEAILSSHNK